MKHLLKNKTFWIVVLLAVCSGSYSHYANQVIELQNKAERRMERIESNLKDHKHHYGTGLSDFSPSW